MDGDEVVQLYGRDVVASIVRPVQELIGICRVSLLAGEARTVRFSFNLNQLAFPDEHGVWQLEPASSPSLWAVTAPMSAPKRPIRWAQGRRLDPAGRSFFAEASVLAEE